MSCDDWRILFESAPGFPFPSESRAVHLENNMLAGVDKNARFAPD